MAVDLTALDYPRHLHQDAGEFQVVDTAEQCQALLSAGWYLWPWNDWRRGEEFAERGSTETALAEADESPVVVALKRKPGRPKKVPAQE